MVKITLSVVMMNYNHAHLMEPQLQRVLQQAADLDELIIIDDASTDDSLATLKYFRDQAPKKVLLVENDKNQGVLANIEKSLSLAKGEFIYWASMDDLIDENFFKRFRYAANEKPSLKCYTGNSIVIQEHAKRAVFATNNSACTGFYESSALAKALSSNSLWLAGHASIVKKREIQQAFDYELGAYIDWYALASIGYEHGLYFDAEVFNSIRVASENYSSDGTRNIKKATFQIALKKLSRVEMTDFRSWVRKSGILEHSLLLWLVLVFEKPSLVLFFSFSACRLLLKKKWQGLTTRFSTPLVNRLFGSDGGNSQKLTTVEMILFGQSNGR
jgi:glycosyltransferase involved in cell wall biosynthesis